MTAVFNLYSSDGCHLCEQALALCLKVTAAESINVIDIVDDESQQLVKLYGVHIPVLERLSDNEKLFWPFSAQQIKELV